MKFRPKLASRRLCTGCMACVDACSAAALTGHIASDGHLYPKFDSARCTACRKCERACPIASGFDFRRADGHSQAFAAWANNDQIRARSASGGVFASLAVKFIQDGGVVSGASLHGLEVRHIIINRVEDVALIQGSKYQQGDLSGIYKAIFEHLEAGQKVLFGGTPCQVAALLNFVTKCENKHLLTTADLICGGFPSILPMQMLVENEEISAITSFRNKARGWTPKHQFSAINTQQKVINFSDQNIVTKTFNSHILNRSSCLNCKFCVNNRASDLTLADFWGDNDFPTQHKHGLSLVITHSFSGVNILNNSDLTIHETTFAKAIQKNHRYHYGRYFLRLHPARILARTIFKHCTYRQCRKIFMVEKTSQLNIFLAPIRLYNTIFRLVFSFERNRNTQKFIKNTQ